MKNKIICFLVFIVGLIIVCNIFDGKEGLGEEESIIIPDTEPVITPMPEPTPVEPVEPVDPVEPVEPVEPGHGGGGGGGGHRPGHRPGHGGGHRPGPGHRPRRNTFWGFYRSWWPFRSYYPVDNKVIEITDNYEYPNSTLYWLLFIMVCIVLVLYADHKKLI